MTKPQPKKSSGTPLIIIVLVLVVAVILGAFYYNSSRTPTARPGPTPSGTKTPIPQVSQVGAQPPNFLGSQNASVTIEEFADFQCGSCAASHPILKQVQSIYGQRIKFIFRHFPLPMHDKSYDAAVAAEAAGMQGSDKFWAMHNQLFTNQQSWASDPNYKQTWKTYAEKIGLDVNKYETDMAGIGAKGRVDADLQRGRALNINSTPTVFINGKPVPYPDMNVPTLQKLIDEELRTAQGGQQPAQSAPASTPAASATGAVQPKR